eukprot:CCRYP_001603-RA/>CCRYP_001603-RA protein AED:0.24 eAED:0.18 QI:0/0/0/1/1/1/2/0/837
MPPPPPTMPITNPYFTTSQPPQPYPPQPYTSRNRNNRNNGNRGRGRNNMTAQGPRNNPPHPVKRYNNWWYCFSCGFDTPHEGTSCTRQATGHLAHLTREQKIADMHLPIEQQRYRNASHAGHHKRILPSQAAANGYHYTPTPTSSNTPSPPITDDDDITIITSNCSSCPRQPSSTDTISTNHSNPSTSTFSCASHANSINITLGTDEAIADSGATAHFLLPSVTISNKRKATHPLNITLPDGEVIQSTHEGNLNLPGLGDAATLAHVVPGLAHSSLLSIKQLCDNGCHVLFTKQDCKDYRKAELMLVGKRHPATGLWVVPTNSHPISTKPPSAFASHAAHNAYQTTSKAKLIQFLHQCAFSPPPSTWIKAINNNQFATWPGLTADAVRRYLPDSTATAKGHMKKTPAGVRSTRTTPTPTIHRPPSTCPPSPPPNYEDLFPPQEPNTINHIFCWAALADQIDGTTYTDLTGRFPTMSLENKQYIFVAYDYTTNAIIVRAITDRESSTIVKAFDDIFTYLAAKGFKPQFNVLDNEASHAITEYLRQQNIKWQFVPPNEHRVNAAEQAIQTFKNHLIAGLCSTDRDFPSQLWDKLLQQAQDSLNMLRTSRIDPTKSAYEILEGPHDFNRNPWAPPGCRAILHKPATTRTSWGPRGTDAWYISPAMHHYRSYEFYVPETRSYCISASAKFFPSYCDLPTESPLEAAARTAAELLIELRQQRDPQDPTQLSRHQRAIKIINDIYQLNSQQAPRVNTQTAPPPRVEPTLSSNPTAPRILGTTSRLHTRVTQRNTPGLTTVPTPPRRSPRLNPNIPNTSVETAPTPPSQLPSPEPTGTTPVAPP